MQDSRDAGRRNVWLGRVIAFAILVLAGVNGVFTYSGAGLFVDVWYYALLFAVAVQFAIAISLIALPSVFGVGRLVLLIVYLAALSLSTASAYSFVYTAGTEGRLASVRDLDAADRAAIGAVLGDVLSSEQRALERARSDLASLARGVEEEAGLGMRSGRGPGKGPEYYRKLERLRAAEQQLELDRQRVAELERRFDRIAAELAATARPGQRERLLPMLSQLQAQTRSEAAGQRLRGLLQDTLGARPNPVESALASVFERDQWSLSLLISLVWAAIFDLLALFLGIVRYYLLRPGESVLKSIHDGLTGLWLFGLRLARLPHHARRRLDEELEQAGRNTPLNSIEMQNFATYLLAADPGEGESSAEAGAAIGRLIRRIEPLGLPAAPDRVGIPYPAVEDEPALRNLIAFMIRHRVFENDVENRCYVLAAGGELAHKVLG